MSMTVPKLLVVAALGLVLSGCGAQETKKSNASVPIDPVQASQEREAGNAANTSETGSETR